MPLSRWKQISRTLKVKYLLFRNIGKQKKMKEKKSCRQEGSWFTANDWGGKPRAHQTALDAYGTNNVHLQNYAPLRKGQIDAYDSQKARRWDAEPAEPAAGEPPLESGQILSCWCDSQPPRCTSTTNV